jgi:hypothetical protein
MVSGNAVDPALLLRFGFTSQQKAALNEIRKVSPFVAECIVEIVDKEKSPNGFCGGVEPVGVSPFVAPTTMFCGGVGSVPVGVSPSVPPLTMFCGAVGSLPVEVPASLAPPTMLCGDVGSFPFGVGCDCRVSACSHHSGNEAASIKFFEAPHESGYNPRLFPDFPAARSGGGDVEFPRKFLVL